MLTSTLNVINSFFLCYTRKVNFIYNLTVYNIIFLHNHMLVGVEDCEDAPGISLSALSHDASLLWSLSTSISHLFRFSLSEETSSFILSISFSFVLICASTSATEKEHNTLFSIYLLSNNNNNQPFYFANLNHLQEQHKLKLIRKKNYSEYQKELNDLSSYND